MSHLTVTWHCYDSFSENHPGFNLDNLGGSYSFKEGMRWPDYIAGYASEWYPYLEAIRQSIIERGVWAGGDWHQYSDNGAPVVAGGHFMVCSFRSWGDLMAAVWSSELNRDFSYIDFYMDGRLPTKANI
ncbi:hypothetical protein ACFST9_15735 [Hymenobacter monticola]|uniref:Uncharacterized protein n=1 Tax=Hymenobacter monticola TaxID=1705399 RepID=A0ABY4B4E2_9BACT|nr:hypothetical protein [Hymenobacter monticola]UOE32638.1 hypothetical protein MTP16_16050 [Hymenobacter monticola]